MSSQSNIKMSSRPGHSVSSRHRHSVLLVWKYLPSARRSPSFFDCMLTTGSSQSSSVEKLPDCSYSVQTPRWKCQDRIQGSSSPTRSGLNTGYQVIKSTKVVNRSITHRSRQRITEEIRTEPKTQQPIENATMEYRLAASTTNVRIHTKSGANREECEMSAGSAEPT
jgi:hypothetical protein